MLEAEYRSRTPRVQVSAATAEVASTGSRRLRLDQPPNPQSDTLLDLSNKGLKLLTSGPAPAVDDLLDFELRHPHLRGPIELTGRVKWVQEDVERTWRVGIHFEDLRDTTRVALAQLIVLELGSTIYGSAGQVGFVSPGRVTASGEERYYVYSLRREEKALITPTAGTFLMARTGDEDTQAYGSLVEALTPLFPEAGTLRVMPPISARKG